MKSKAGIVNNLKVVSNSNRRFFSRDERKTILIYCGGKNTEPSYFKKFKLTNVHIKREGLDPWTLAQLVINLKQIGKFDEYWVVFDKDDYLDQNFNSAIQLANQNHIRVAYSNQAFEYWLLLHFDDHNGGSLNRSEYGKKLNKILAPFGVEYDYQGRKNVEPDLFELMEAVDPVTSKTRVNQAIIRAKRIYDNHDHRSPAKEESSTTVFMLVEELLKYR